MSIFRESFPDFIQEELTRRQDGMLLRTPNFIHQLNSRSAWVKMTSGVNVDKSNELAKKYVLQGGILNNNTINVSGKVVDNFALKSGLNSGGTAYDNLSPGGIKNRLGLRPMPGITNVSIQSKSAYGSLQEAVVNFIAWDIRQLEELELLYMRPGYTVLLEFGWNYAKSNGILPSYDILNSPPIALNDAFKNIYNLISTSGGNYDALLGYVKNYNWSARDDGGYDCSTTIISLGEVLESLKCNWIPMNTNAFNPSGKGLLNLPSPTLNISTVNTVIESYKKGIIPGLLQEMYNYAKTQNITNFVIKDTPNKNGTTNYYDLFKIKVKDSAKNDRGGLAKPLGKNDDFEYFITLNSFCNLINKHVLITDGDQNPLVQITTNEQGQTGELTKELLKCIASPLSLSTNLGICFVQNDNWNNLKININNSEESKTDIINLISPDIKTAIGAKTFANKAKYYPNNVFNRFAGNIVKKEIILSSSSTNPVDELGNLIPIKSYSYNSSLGLQGDINKLATDLGNALTDVKLISGKDKEGNSILIPKFFFFDGSSFLSSNPSNTKTVNFLDYFGVVDEPRRGGISSGIYEDIFFYNYDPVPPGKLNIKNIGFEEDPFTESKFNVKDNKGITWTKKNVVDALQKALSNVPLSSVLQKRLTEQLPQVAQQIADIATNNSNGINKNYLTNSYTNTKQLGYIGNIYVNLNFLYEQAISKNSASNDTQNKNNISVLSYFQGILREIQNSLGNVNSFDIQVDSRNAIGRIIDINYTGNPSEEKEPFTLQIQNLNSVVRSYKFTSKIFPEMGSIIAISAQDPEGVGILGYDNATLVAWNEGISDRILPKKLTVGQLPDSNVETTYILPFLTQMWDYFNVISGKGTKDDNTLVYGGLNFAFRDFLSNIDKFDERNKFKTIIPTELSVKLDGLGGVIIGNLFQINQDIVPKGYKNVGGRKLAYITTGINHQLVDNDWVTELSAYPIVFEQATGTNVAKNWDNNKYSLLSFGNVRIGNATISFSKSISDVYIPARDRALNNRKRGLQILLTAQAQLEGFRPGNINYDLNNPGNFTGKVGNIPISGRGQGGRSKFVQYDTLENGIKASAAQIDIIIEGKSKSYPKDPTLLQYVETYAPSTDGNNVSSYVNFIVGYFKKEGYDISDSSKLQYIVNL
jgi:hypothetical protein